MSGEEVVGDDETVVCVGEDSGVSSVDEPVVEVKETIKTVESSLNTLVSSTCRDGAVRVIGESADGDID